MYCFCDIDIYDGNVLYLHIVSIMKYTISLSSYIKSLSIVALIVSVSIAWVYAAIPASVSATLDRFISKISSLPTSKLESLSTVINQRISTTTNPTHQEIYQYLQNGIRTIIANNNTKNTNTSDRPGRYEWYSASAVQQSLQDGAPVVLFFHAAWCSTCRSLEKDLTASIWSLPANSVVYKIDYDTATQLKRQYGVTMQHTLIRLAPDSSVQSKKTWIWLQELIGLLQ